MKRILIVLALLALPIALLCTQQNPLYIRVDVEIVELAEAGFKDYGIEKSLLTDIITKNFAAANIIVKSDPDLPKFLLHIKSLPTDNTIATFVQGSFYEESTIVHTEKTIWAITWTQTNIIACPKSAYTKTVQDEAINIVNSFISDYQRREETIK